MPNFNDVFNELCRDPANRELEYAIKSWYRKANFNDREIQEINEYRKGLLQQQEFISDIGRIYKTLLGVTNQQIPVPINFVGELFIKDLSHKLTLIASNTQQEIRKVDTKLVLLVALGLAGIGFIAYKTQKTRDRGNLPTPTQTRQPAAPRSSIPSSQSTFASTTQSSQKIFLFLVLKAYKVSEDIIHKLRKNGITPDIIDQAFSITAIEALWQGTEKDYLKNNLDSDLKKSGVQTPSTSDVYLVKIELDRSYTQFDPNSDRMIRYEAFEKMIGTKPKIEISERLAVTDYNPAVLYR